MKTIPHGHLAPTPGTLYTAGYADRKGAELVERLMRQERIRLLDIRFSPKSRWYPTWNYQALRTKYGDTYQWERRLGNLNYRDRHLDIVLADGHEDAVREAATQLLEGWSLIIMCACADPQRCHRTRVAKAIQDAVSALQYPQAADDVPLYLDLKSAQAALDRGERVKIAMQPLSIDPTHLQLAQDLQDRARIAEAIRRAGEEA